MNPNIMLLSEATDSNATMWIFVALLVVLVVVLLVVPMFQNKKRAKQTMELHNSLQPGDKIKTVGGIIGTIKEIRNVSPGEREMVIETGSGDNKTTMVFDIQALYQVIDRMSNAAAENTDAAETDILLARNDDVNVVNSGSQEQVANKAEEVKATETETEVAKSEEVAVKDESVEKTEVETETAAVVATEEVSDEKKDDAEIEAKETTAESAVKTSTTTRKPAAKKSANATPAKKKPVNSTKNSTKK